MRRPLRKPPLRATGHETLRDCVFLALVTVLSLALYVHELGFYADDYSFLAILTTSHHHSFSGLYDAIASSEPSKKFRPLQIVLLVVPYLLFGTRPVPYHLLNAGLLLAAVVLLYAVVRELRQPRVLALGVSCVYATMPHFSTDRLWWSSFQANASIGFYLFATLGALRAVRCSGIRRLGWITASGVAMFASALSYEVALPLLLLTPVLVVVHARSSFVRSSWAAVREARSVLLLYGAALVGVAIWKFIAAIQLGKVSSYHLGLEQSLPDRVLYLAAGAVKVSVVTYGVALPYVLGWILASRFNVLVLGVAVATTAIVFAYLRAVARREPNVLEASEGWTRVLVIGGVVFVLGYAVFLTNPEGAFSSVTIDNRINIAGALGVAISVVALAGWISARFLRSLRHRVQAFALLVAIYCGAGVLVLNTIAQDWSKSYDKQRAVLGELATLLPSPRHGTGIILDGVCPAIGPGIVFHARQDFTAALKTMYRDPTLEGGTTTVGYTIVTGGNGVVLRRDRPGTGFEYPYSKGVLLFDYPRDSLRRLPNAKVAARRFAALDNQCGTRSSRSFNWGLHRSRWVPLASVGS